MVYIHLLFHERLSFSDEFDCAFSLSAVEGPNSSPQTKSVLGKLQIGLKIVVYVSMGSAWPLFVSLFVRLCGSVHLV